MQRLVALPLFGLLTVAGLTAATGGFDGVPATVVLGWLLVGVLGVMGIVAGFSFARGYRGSRE